MLEFIQYIFSSFWIWLGFAALIILAGSVVAAIIRAAVGAKQDDDED